MAISQDRTTLYYYLGNSVYAHSITQSQLSQSPFFSVADAVNIYGIGVNPNTGEVYVGDSKAFDGVGEVFRYSVNGTFVESFSVGVGPNGFAFN